MSEPHLLVLSADTPGALEQRTDELADTLTRAVDLATVARELRTRPALEYRRAVVTTDPARAAEHLRRRDPRLTMTGRSTPDRPVVFMFAGVGDHYAGMAAGLARYLPAFAAELDRCLRVLGGELGLDLRAILHPHATAATRRDPDLAALFDDHDDGATPEIHRTHVAQPLMFAVEYALAATLRDLGVRPSALVGYSIGEYVAACVAGVLAPDSALRLVARRARLVAELPAGGMLAVTSGPDPLVPHLNGDVSVAALDGPQLTVLAGPVHALELVAKRLAEQGIASRRLSTMHAFHSPLMDPVVRPLRDLVGTYMLRPPAVPLLSNGSGTWMRDEATSPDYWAGHLRNPVRFADNLAEIWRLPDPVLVELGPGQSLIRLALQSPSRHGGLAVPTLPGPLESRPDVVVFRTAIGRLWTAIDGVDLERLCG